MQLLQLPFELQLLILNHIKKDNHLDLAPLAHTCMYYFTMVADRFNWTNTVTILQPSRIHSSSLNYLMNARSITLITKRLQAVSDISTFPLILNILEKQQSNNNLQDIQMLVPTKAHHKIYQTLTNFPQTKLKQLTVRDPTDGGYIMSPIKYHLLLSQFITTTLSKSQSTLDQLDLSSFPSNILVSQYNNYQFPLVKSLKIALVGCQDQHHFHHYWRQFKSTFPNLQDLTLTVTKQHISLFKFLLQDISLFPWIKRLSVSSRETPKEYLSREELRSSMSGLNGLYRITAGWDMIDLS
ncbi:hypothetical protein INT47_005990 [Mucor saturninus]|uniref:F-box domain-containing protein n=1 Tax=Mucor saturninus TaxID=64648 RepID=A0A8H7UVJ0_9FUNG|nr:hypothetical protein INT47_005990 [Mucor saturninus]